jgi:hypothetical protein
MVWLIWWCDCICYQVLADVCVPHGVAVYVIRSLLMYVCRMVWLHMLSGPC